MPHGSSPSRRRGGRCGAGRAPAPLLLSRFSRSQLADSERDRRAKSSPEHEGAAADPRAAGEASSNRSDRPAEPLDEGLSRGAHQGAAADPCVAGEASSNRSQVSTTGSGGVTPAPRCPLATDARSCRRASPPLSANAAADRSDTVQRGPFDETAPAARGPQGANSRGLQQATARRGLGVLRGGAKPPRSRPGPRPEPRAEVEPGTPPSQGASAAGPAAPPSPSAP